MLEFHEAWELSLVGHKMVEEVGCVGLYLARTFVRGLKCAVPCCEILALDTRLLCHKHTYDTYVSLKP